MKTSWDLITKVRSTSGRSLWNEFRSRWIRILAPTYYDREDGVFRLPPDWLVLIVNNVCNLKCEMCDVGLGILPRSSGQILLVSGPRTCPWRC